MELSIGTSWAFIVLSLLLNAIRCELNSNETIGYESNQTYGDYNQSRVDVAEYEPSYAESYNVISHAYPGYSHSMSYSHHSSPAYGSYLQIMYSKPSYSYSSTYERGYLRPNYNVSYQTQNYGGYNHSYHQISHGNYNKAMLRSHYQSLPGKYQKVAYNKQPYLSGKRYSAQSVYSGYLASGAYQYHSAKCSNHYGQTPQISSSDLDSAFSYAHQQIGSYGNQYGYNSSNSKYAPVLQLKEKEAILMEYVSEYFAKYKCLSKYHTTTFLPAVTIGQQYTSGNKYGDTSCYSSYGQKGWKLECPDYNSPYRTMDGSCNNRYHPYWGKAYVCHLRLLPPDYSDGIYAPRMGSYGEPLPSARVVANYMAPDLPFDSYYTQLKMAFGQFVNHDITRTPVHGSYAQTSDYSGPLDCCRNRNNKQCYPIDIPPSPYDYQYRNYKNTCLNFVRSAPCPLCQTGPRQQLNIETSYLDASTIYGSTVNDSIALRVLKHGLLRTSPDIYGKPLAPATSTPYQNQCSPPTASMKCFTSGDKRINQHPYLMVMHTILIRRHNEHATALRYVNPHWDDEYLFQVSRKLVIAEIQLITYREYLPIIFGPTLMNYYSLNPHTYGYTNYEPYTDPTTWNDYATAACRFGHSQIQGLNGVMPGYKGGGNLTKGWWLRDNYFNPEYLWEGKIDYFLMSLTFEHSKSVDPYFTNDIRNYLFRKPGQQFGSDLISRNIQRGRDHGIPGYVNYLKFCFGYEVYNWNDLNKFIPADIVQQLKQVYKSVKDIDFYIGGISERHFPDGDVGPTFACVLGIQYYHIKFGDRYYFEHGGQSGSFTPGQLDNIRQTTSLAKIICRTSDYIDGVQRYAFFPQSNYNPKIPCKKYAEINYNLWKDRY